MTRPRREPSRAMKILAGVTFGAVALVLIAILVGALVGVAVHVWEWAVL